MKTILYLSTSSGPGGAERVISNLASSLDPTRFRAHLCLFRPGWIKESSESRGISTHVIPMNGMLDWRWAIRFRRLLLEKHVDLVHTHEFDANVHGTLVAATVGVPVVATIHGKNYYWEKARRRLAYRWVSRHAVMVAVSQDLKGFIVDKVGVSANRIKVVYNGVADLSGFDRTEINQYKQELHIPGSDQVVGVVGNLYPVKGHQYLIETIPAVLSVCPNTAFIFAGRGQLESSLKEQVRRLGIEKKVHFLGLRQDIPKLLGVMDMFVLPSLSEGLSMAILEAMVAAKPIVATLVGGNPELVQQGITGFLVPPKDSGALGASIAALLKDQGLARSMGRQGKARAEKYFSLAQMVAGYQALYDTCFRSGPPDPILDRSSVED